MPKKYLKEIIDVVWKNIGRKKPFEINVIQVGATRIQSLNKKYRRKNKPTTVLSFCYESHWEDYFIGEIYLCPPQIKKDSRLWQESYRAHLARLLVHGTLHLFGFRHDNNKQTSKMEKLETQILKNV